MYLALGVLYVGHSIYDNIHQYLSLENGRLIKNKLSGWNQEIDLKKISAIQKNGTDYTLIGVDQKFKIHTKLIEEPSLIKLNEILENLHLPADKTPFEKVAS